MRKNIVGPTDLLQRTETFYKITISVTKITQFAHKQRDFKKKIFQNQGILDTWDKRPPNKYWVESFMLEMFYFRFLFEKKSENPIEQSIARSDLTSFE